MFNKKGMALETIVKAVLLLTVLFVIIYVFRGFFGKEVGVAGEHISALEKDSDCDGVKDAVDKCPYDHLDQLENNKCKFNSINKNPDSCKGVTNAQKQ